MTSALIEEMRKEVNEIDDFYRFDDNPSNISFITIFDNGEWKKWENLVCYGEIRDIPRTFRDNNIVGMVSTPFYTDKRKEAAKSYRDYIHWVVNDSPWADSHLEKDADSVIARGMVHDVNWPVQYIVQGGILIRKVYEAPASIDTIHKVHEVTGDWLKALFVSMYISRVPTGWMFDTYNACHHIYEPRKVAKDVIKNIYNNNRENFKKFPLLCEKKPYWIRLNTIWGEEIDDWVWTDISPTKQISLPDLTIPVSAWRSPRPVKGCTDEQFPDVVEHIIKQLEKR